MSFKLPDTVEIDRPKPMGGWGIPAPAIEDEEGKKKQFAEFLANGLKPFEAACSICGQNTNLALWIAQNWVNDPIVKQLRETVDTGQSLLDKDQLALKFLSMAEEKNATNTFYLLDGKDRLKALELYAKVKGLLDTKDNGATNFIHNHMTIKLIEPEKKLAHSSPIIDNDVSPIQNQNSPIKLKLVTAG